MGAVPSLHTGEQKRHGAYQRSQHHHRVKTYQTTTEETAHCKRFAPTVVVGIANDKAREQEEEVDGKIAVVDKVDEGLVACKLKTFEYMIPYDEHCSHATQTVKQGIVGF